MGTTANYQIPYPELTEPPDGPAQMKALTQRIDTLLKTVNDNAGRILGQSLQVAAPPFTTTGILVDFTNAAFPYLNVIAPPSGKIAIQCGAEISNTNSASASIRVTARPNPAPPSDSGGNLMIRGTGLAGMHYRLYQGFTPGAAVQLIPQWYISSGTAAVCSMQFGALVAMAAL